MNFRSDRLAALRKEQGYKQTELADDLGTTQRQISQYERGAISPSADTLVALAQKLNTSTDYLLGLSNIPYPGAEPDANADLTPQEREWLMLLRENSATNQNRLFEIVKSIRDMQEEE